MINQGDIYWARQNTADAIAHPYVVVQDNLFNHSRLTTVIACALTTNLKRVSMPGSVLIAAGEANLPAASVVEVSKITTLGKAQLGDYIGTLSAERVAQILAGIRFLGTAFHPPAT